MENNKTTGEKQGYLIDYPNYNLYNKYKECPERMWYERPRTECNCD